MRRNPLLTREYYQALYKFRKEHPKAIPNVIGVSSGVINSLHFSKNAPRKAGVSSHVELSQGRKRSTGITMRVKPPRLPGVREDQEAVRHLP